MKLSRWITAATAAVASALMPACDIVNLNEIRPGITTAAEVRARMGEPGFIHHDNDGTAIWEYSRQPQGVHCYMIAFDRKDVVTRMDQVLNDANYARIADGLSKDDVRRILGVPATKVVFDNLRHGHRAASAPRRGRSSPRRFRAGLSGQPDAVAGTLPGDGRPARRRRRHGNGGEVPEGRRQRAAR